MRFWFPTFALLGMTCFLMSSARGDDCVCAKVPMFPVTDGWFHYAIVCDQPGCISLYPTGLIREFAENLVCGSPGCGDCDPLGGASASSGHDLHFNDPLESAANMVDKTKFRAFLKKIAGTLGPDVEVKLGGYSLTEPRVISLNRNVPPHGLQPFHAVVWELQKGSKPHGFIGVETLAPGPSVPVTTASSVANAVHSSKGSTAGTLTHTPVPGLLQVQVNSVDVAFIRLNKTSNIGAVYPPVHRASLAVESRKAVSMAPNVSGCCPASCTTTCFPVFCQPYSATIGNRCFRVQRRRCR